MSGRKQELIAGVDEEKQATIAEQERHLAAIDQDARDAGAVRLTGTPSFIVGKTTSDRITGEVIIGAQPLKFGRLRLY